MTLRVADKACAFPARPLYGNIDDPEHFIADMLTHEQPADFPFASTLQLTQQAPDQLARQKKLHSCTL